jgi:UDP-N-acetylmuramyl tripeptide synthase
VRLGPRGVAAVALGRAALWSLRAFGQGGTTAPGRLALAVDPDLPGRLARALPQGLVLVTGTNGKTTTAAMLAEALAAHGWRLAYNRGGGNLRGGLATALLAGLPADLGLLEVDEGTMPYAGRLGARLAVVTNFFRDQLDRYGELEATVLRVRRGLEAMPPEAVVVANADDPLCLRAVRGLGLGVRTFGLDDAVAADAEAPRLGEHAVDLAPCPACGGQLVYAVRRFAQLGHWRCPACGLERAVPDVRVVAWRPPEGGRPGAVRLETPRGPLETTLRLPGLHNAYNLAAAVAAAWALGLDLGKVAEALGAFRHAFGRMEWAECAGHPLCLVLVKNPAGCTLALAAALQEPAPGKSLLVLLNDGVADGTDVSWIWDADFEALAGAPRPFAAVVASGRRAWDLAVRLKYAGVDPARIRVAPDPGEGLRQALRGAAPGAPVYALPTYTAMLALRALLVRRGVLPRFWEVGGARPAAVAGGPHRGRA